MSRQGEVVSPEGLRKDGRRAKETRKIKCKLGFLTGVDGSALFEQGHTKVIASVYGPREVKKRAEALHDRAFITCEYSQATFSTSERKVRSKQDRRSKEYALLICQTFESVILTQLYPRSQITILLQVIQEDGGALSASITAASLALINAGIPMKDFVVACSAGFVENTPILDLNYFERSTQTPDLHVAMYPKSGKIATMHMVNKLAVKHLAEVLNLACQGCKDIYRTLKASVQSYSESVLNARGILQS